MKNNGATEIGSVELLPDDHRDRCDLLDPGELALMRVFFLMLDEWDGKGTKHANGNRN
jgi:hypothetical protein